MSVSPSGKSKKILIIIIAIILVAVGIAYRWYLRRAERRVVPAAPGVAASGTVNQPTPDLGSTLYNKASNPVSGKLPSTVAPVPNPVKGLYKNPF